MSQFQPNLAQINSIKNMNLNCQNKGPPHHWKSFLKGRGHDSVKIHFHIIITFSRTYEPISTDLSQINSIEKHDPNKLSQ